jgi:uncharacterized protein
MRSSSLLSVLCLFGIACAADVSEPTSSANQQQSVRDGSAPDASPVSACAAAGGVCTGLTPSACKNGHFVADLCGVQVGASCCVPDAKPDAGACTILKGSNGSANPASVYCAEMGFTSELVNGPGGQSANCVFKDGTKCEEWSFYRGQCGEKHSFCARQGGTVRSDSSTRPGFTFAMCDLPGGATCKEQEFSQTCVCP